MRPDPFLAASAKLAAAAAAARYDFELLQSTRAADRLVAAYGLTAADAVAVVAGERRRRADDAARAARQATRA